MSLRLGDTYRNRKRQLNRAEAALYEHALKIGVRAICPAAEARRVCEGYDREIELERARAEAARLARAQGKQNGTGAGPVLTDGGAQVVSEGGAA